MPDAELNWVNFAYVKYKIIGVLLLPLFSFRCINKNTRANFIEVDNQLTKNVFCLPSFNYPDTTLNFTNKAEILANDGIYSIKAASKEQLFYKPLCDKNYWSKIMKADTLQIFVIEEKTLKEKSWGSIYSNNLYLRRLVFSYTDIINNGCRITIR